MPTTSNPARTSSAAVTEESTPPDIATTTRWLAGLPERSISASGIEAHLPEIGLEPGGGSEARRQCRESALAAAPGELLVESGRSLAREVLVLRAGIHFEPVAVAVAVEARRRIGNALGGDLGIADDAGRQRDFEVEPVAGEAAIEHEAGIGDRLQRLGLRRHTRLRQIPAAAVFNVQPDLDIERRGDQRLRAAHLGERFGFVDSQPPGAGEMQEEEIILHEIAPEGRLGQVAARYGKDEFMAGIGGPSRAGGGGESPEQLAGHGSAEQ